MSWWKRFSFRKPAESSAAGGLLRSVAMTIPGWHEDPPTETMRTWHHPDGGVLSVGSVPRQGIPPLTQLDAVRDAFRRIAERSGAGLVEADVIQSAYGAAARMIYKRRVDSAFVYTGMLLLPAHDQWLVFTAVDAERETTGIREAVVIDQLLRAGEITADSYEQSWARDPYRPKHRGADPSLLRFLSDDETYDQQFPQHPLSNVRRTLNLLLENVFVER